LLLRSISGLRGTVGKDEPGLNAEVVSRYALAFANYVGRRGSIALGYDGRQGGSVFYELASAALRSAGCDVLMLGMVPTPTVQMAAEHAEGVVGGIAITASHNPGEWNGMKFIAPTGMFLDAEENRKLWELYDADSRQSSEQSVFGTIRDGHATVQQHIDAVLHNRYVDCEAIAVKKFRVVLDAVNASGSVVQPALLRALGVAEIIEVACDSSGIFPHRPEPIPQNLTSLSEAVLKHKADLGIAVDPDADRLVLIMENGEPFIEENTIVLACEQVLSKEKSGATVVVNLSTTRAVDDIAKQFGAKVVRTPVGEINVSKRMKELGAVVGGEGSGGIILPSVHLGRDSLVGVALALSALANFEGTISEKKRSLPQYTIVKHRIDLASASQVGEVLSRLEQKFGNEAIAMNREDGLRIDLPTGWIHARASNTEPIIRIIAEAPPGEAEKLMAEAIG